MFNHTKIEKDKIREAVSEALQDITLTSETGTAFSCPFWVEIHTKRMEAEKHAHFTEQAYEKIKVENEHLALNVQNLEFEKSTLLSKITNLSNELESLKEKTIHLQTTLDIATTQLTETRKSKDEMQLKIIRYETVHAETAAKIPEVTSLVQKLKHYENAGILGTNTLALVKNVLERLEKVPEYDDVRLPGAVALSLELGEKLSKKLATLPKPREDYLKETKKQIEAVKSVIRSNESCDSRIPLHFLKICEILLDKAQDFLKENNEELARVQELTCIEILHNIRQLYEDQTFRLQLGILRGSVHHHEC